ncbi:MAG: DUF2244 domain-containing protein [Rudaea sp.]|uniref:DUF2244 domain-containing protein n=1 Tax=Rudaea sp. TaxID=2136325 RepID=UPI0039E2C0B1
MAQTLKAGSMPARLVILPHCSLTRAGLCLFLALQGMAMASFAGLAAWRGNVFAPYFAVLDWCVVAYVLSRVWRRSAAGETIALSASGLEVARMDGSAPPLRFHPYWVRVELLPGRHLGWASRLMLRSHGREVEVGRFLNEAERAELARQLNEMLADVRRQARAD